MMDVQPSWLYAVRVVTETVMMVMMTTFMSPSMTSVIMMTDPSLLTLMHHLHILMLMNHMHISLCKRARERVRGQRGRCICPCDGYLERCLHLDFLQYKTAITGKAVMIGRRLSCRHGSTCLRPARRCLRLAALGNLSRG